MKKVIIRTLSAILSISVLLSCIFCLTISADETEARPSCVADHFNRLQSTIRFVNDNATYVYNTPPSEDTCGYAAISMLLAFYDSYWHERFVPDDLEWDKGMYNSVTDNIAKTFSAETEYQAWQEASDNGDTYGEFVNDTYDEYLESYLITLGKELGYCNDNSTIYPLIGTTAKSLLEYYLYDIQDFTTDQVTVHIERAADPGHSDETLFNTMKEHILDGYPVIYAGIPYNVGNHDYEIASDAVDDLIDGHLLMAYDTVGSENNITDIKLHTGWDWAGHEHTTVNTTEYDSWNYIIWLEINEENLPHQCTDAYHDVATDTDICACKVYYNTHPAHVCGKKSNTMTSYDSAGHHYECTCGAPIIENHNYTNYTSVDLRHHTAVCADCGYSTLDAHAWKRISLSISMCDYCGQTKDHLNGKPGMVPLDDENEEEIE